MAGVDGAVRLNRKANSVTAFHDDIGEVDFLHPLDDFFFGCSTHRSLAGGSICSPSFCGTIPVVGIYVDGDGTCLDQIGLSHPGGSLLPVTEEATGGEPLTTVMTVNVAMTGFCALRCWREDGEGIMLVVSHW